MTVRELKRAVHFHRGKVSVPVLIPDDVVHLIAEKKDLIDWLSGYGLDERAPLVAYNKPSDGGILHLDSQGPEKTE